MPRATATLAVHFALQLTLGLRAMGVTQSVMLNLAMLIPASYLFARAVLLLQRHGRLNRWDRWAGPLAWGAAMTMLLAAALVDGGPLLGDSPQRQWAEIAGALCYLADEEQGVLRISVISNLCHCCWGFNELLLFVLLFRKIFVLLHTIRNMLGV